MNRGVAGGRAGYVVGTSIQLTLSGSVQVVPGKGAGSGTASGSPARKSPATRRATAHIPARHPMLWLVNPIDRSPSA